MEPKEIQLVNKYVYKEEVKKDRVVQDCLGSGGSGELTLQNFVI